jgi:hypothetical protein
LENDIQFISVKKIGTDLESINLMMEELNIDQNRYKKLMTLPVLIASVNASADVLIYCFPLSNAIMKIPKRGD